MTPPQLQLHVDASSTEATDENATWRAPGDHAASTGTHNCGVSTPLAALVALATAGFASELHIPNVAIDPDLTSRTPPAAMEALTERLVAENVAGALP